MPQVNFAIMLSGDLESICYVVVHSQHEGATPFCSVICG